MGAQGQGCRKIFEDILQIEIQVFEIEFSGFDLGKIENVVDSS
jgi:hypothetical protein